MNGLGLDVRVSDARVRPRLSTPLLAVVLCLVWSSAFIFVKLALRDAPAEVFTAQRALAAAPVLLAALLIRDAAGLGRALREPRVHVVGLVLGATLVAGFLAFSTLGLELSGIGFGVVLIYAQPLLVAGIARVALNERLSPRQVVGLFVGWAGIALAVLGELSGADPGPHVWQAALLFLGSAVCFAVGTVVVKAVTSGPRAVPLPPTLLLAFVYGSVPLVGFATTADEPVHWTGSLVVSVLYAGVVSLAIGYLLQFALLERGDAGVVSSYIFAVPILAAVYGVLIFDEKLSIGLVVGAVAVAAAILLVTVPGRTRLLEETP
jgi:drug/metabolite transporter (DMT)-like permease